MGKMNRRASQAHLPDSEGLRGDWGDGFGGHCSAKFSSPLETLPAVPTNLPAIPRGTGPVMVYGNKGIDEKGPQGGVIHGCGEHGCGFEARTPHGLARHVRARHGFGGLGRGLKR